METDEFKNFGNKIYDIQNTNVTGLKKNDMEELLNNEKYIV